MVVREDKPDCVTEYLKQPTDVTNLQIIRFPIAFSLICICKEYDKVDINHMFYRFQYACKMWEAVKKSPFLQEYMRLLIWRLRDDYKFFCKNVHISKILRDEHLRSVELGENMLWPYSAFVFISLGIYKGIKFETAMH